MATKVEDKVKKDQAKTAYGQADIDREMLDKRDKYEAGVSKKFGIGDSPYEKFSGPDYYKGKKAGGSCKGYAKGGSASRGDGCAIKGHTKGRMI
jgi:hypothetical protein